MPPYYTKENNQFKMMVGSDGIVTLTLTGDLKEEDVSAFVSTLDLTSLTISHLFAKTHTKLKILLDASGFSGNYCANAVMALADFAKKNKPYIEKTACFGLSIQIKIVGQVIIAIAQRDNISIFNTEKEARTWLSKND